MNKLVCSALLAALLFSHSTFAQQPRAITLATTAWCPYTCTDKQFNHGVIGHYIKQILADNDIQVTIESYPWSRAIQLANNGQVDGLLTAVHAEAPELLFSSVPISHFQVCFYGRINEQWNFQKQNSQPEDNQPTTLQPLIHLNQRILGIQQDYGYGEPLDSFIANPPNHARLVTLTGDNGTTRLIDMLLSQRIDLFAEDQVVADWLISKQGLPNNIVSKRGCLRKQPYYLALHASQQNKQLIININSALAKQENQALLASFIHQLTHKPE